MNVESLKLLQLLVGVVNAYFTTGQPPTPDQKAALAKAGTDIQAAIESQLAKAAKAGNTPAN